MSNDMKLFLKAFAALGLIGGIVATVILARSQSVTPQDQLVLDEPGRYEQKRQVGINAERGVHKDAEPRSMALQKTTSQQQNKRHLQLHDISTSPDKRFLSAIADHQTVSELVVWPITGGASILREKLAFANEYEAHWLGKDRILIQNTVWKFYRDKGRWQLSEQGNLPSHGMNANPVDASNSFPHQDIRLQIEINTVSEGDVARAEGRLAAYSLTTGVELPLPQELQRQTTMINDLGDIKPLSRWGRTPLRLVQWKSSDQVTSNGLVSSSELMVWDAQSKKRLWKKRFPATSGSPLVGTGGTFVVAVGTPRRDPVTPAPPGTVYYYNGERVEKMPESEVTYSMKGIEVYDSANGKLMAQVTVDGISHGEVIISPNGQYISVPVYQAQPNEPRQDRFVLIYDARTLRLMKKIKIQPGTSPSAFSPDNKFLVVNTEGQLLLYDWQVDGSKGKTLPRKAWL